MTKKRVRFVLPATWAMLSAMTVPELRVFRAAYVGLYADLVWAADVELLRRPAK